MWSCIEAGEAYLKIWKFGKKQDLQEIIDVDVSDNYLWDSPIPLFKGMGKAKLYFLVNSHKTIIRFSENIDTAILDKHILDAVSDSGWKSALPAAISERLVEFCKLSNISEKWIQQIDSLEYRLCRYLADIHKDLIWVLMPQEPGIRLIVMKGKKYVQNYFFSNNPAFRQDEINRIFLCQEKPPKKAVLVSDNTEYTWLEKFLEDKSITVYKDGQDIKKEMITNLCKEK
jgi:hypothetical protein